MRTVSIVIVSTALCLGAWACKDKPDERLTKGPARTDKRRPTARVPTKPPTTKPAPTRSSPSKRAADKLQDCLFGDSAESAASATQGSIASGQPGTSGAAQPAGKKPSGAVSGTAAKDADSDAPGAPSGVTSENSANDARCYAEGVKSTVVDAVPLRQKTGRDAVLAGAEETFWRVLADGDRTLQLTMVSGQSAVFVWHAHATHTAPVLGIPPTQARIGLLGATVVQFNARNEIVELTEFIDELSLRGQLGAHQFAHRKATAAPTGEPVRALASGFSSEAVNLQKARGVIYDFNEHRTGDMVPYYAPNATLSRLWQPDDVVGRDALARAHDAIFAASRDAQNKLRRVWPASDHVAVWVERSGTSTGEMIPGHASARRYAFDQLHVMRIDDGEITQHWVFANGHSLAVQLGLVEAPRS